MSTNQWPDFDVGPEVHTVRRVLLEEGSGIEERSGGTIRFDVESRPHHKGGLVHSCFLVASQLVYRYPFFRVETGREQYPATIVSDEFPEGIKADDEPALRHYLGIIFQSEPTRNVVVQLLDAISGQTV